MSTSSIYYAATDVPMRNESCHAEQAFKLYELGGELWLSCVLSIVTVCVLFFLLLVQAIIQILCLRLLRKSALH